jgi:hypothetical protein
VPTTAPPRSWESWPLARDATAAGLAALDAIAEPVAELTA